MISLADVSKYGLYTIKWILCDYVSRDFIADMGIVQGADVDVVSSFFGNVIVGVNGRQVALSKDVADRIKV